MARCHPRFYFVRQGLTSNACRAAAEQLKRNLGLMHGAAVAPRVQNFERVRVEHNHVLNALPEIKFSSDLQVFGFKSSADDFDNGFGHKADSFLFFFRLAAKDRYIRALHRAVREADVAIGAMNTAHW